MTVRRHMQQLVVPLAKGIDPAAALVTLLRLPPGDLALPVGCAVAALCLSACALRLLGRA